MLIKVLLLNRQLDDLTHFSNVLLIFQLYRCNQLPTENPKTYENFEVVNDDKASSESKVKNTIATNEKKFQLRLFQTEQCI